MDPNAAFSLLLQLDEQVRRHASKAARAAGPDLDADEAYNELVVRFIKRAPRWFAQPAQTTIEAQAVALLKHLGRHIATEHHRRHGKLLYDPDPIERTADRGRSAERSMIRAESDRHVDEVVARTLSNPVHRLLVRCVHLPPELAREDLDQADAWRRGGARAILRPVEPAWGLLSAYRAAPPDKDPERRRATAINLRCTEPPAEVPAARLKTATGWVNRTLYRGLETLALALAEEAP